MGTRPRGLTGRRVWTAGLAFVLITAGSWGQQAFDEQWELATEEGRFRTVEREFQRASAQRQQAEAWVRSRGWPVRGWTPTERLFELQRERNGRLVYYITHNQNAAISAAAHEVRHTAPFHANGEGLIIGIWDGGAVRATHQEFGTRVSIRDGATVIDHATHVGGTIGASGITYSAQGMAPAVTIHSYEWNYDLAECTARAATESQQPTNIYVSNHSYGELCGWAYGNWSGNTGYHWFGEPLTDREDRVFGQYNSEARDWDNLCFNAPYYLPFWAAGNDRSDPVPGAGTTFYYYVSTGPSPQRGWKSKAYDPANDPFADNYKSGGYDTISSAGVAKNTLTIGAVNDAVSGGVRNLGSATMTSFSCWGPTDDGRIKPDLVANGVSLYSTVASTDSSYGTASGTSMSTPNAAGSAMLLIQVFRALFPGSDMRAATLKGLLLHTADDLGNPGPDYRFGWGLMNTRAAADLLLHHARYPKAGHLSERVLTNGVMHVHRIAWRGTPTLRVTLSWTDPPGPVQTGLNVTNQILVNDLDLRIRGPGGAPVYYPFVLNPSAPDQAATTGDNGRDNVEQVVVSAPAVSGVYTVEVTHKGSLTNGIQAYSLIGSGFYEARRPGSVWSLR